MEKKRRRGRPPKKKAKAAEEARMEVEETSSKKSEEEPSRRPGTSKSKHSIEVLEAEIAEGYPQATYYKALAEEMSEYLFFKGGESGMSCCNVDDLPRRVLHNWSLYNSESRLIPLELLLLVKPRQGIDEMFFGSGTVAEDDGSAFDFECDQSRPSSSANDSVAFDGITISLSAMKEWMVELWSPTICISIRTDFAWYSLGRPARLYKLWYEPVIKTARLAMSVITMLKDQSRVSRLSFSDIIRRVSEFKKDHPLYISSNMAVVERYLLVHGQIILQQFSKHLDKLIQRCAFVNGLLEKMEERRYTKVEIRKMMAMKKKRSRGRNPKKKAKAAQKFHCQVLAMRKAKVTEEVQMEDEAASPEASHEEPSLRRMLAKRVGVWKNKHSIKLHDAEIAEDYPPLAYYEPLVEEMNEYLFFKSDGSGMNYHNDELPRRVLHNWSLYDSESRLAPLELLLINACPWTGMTLFASGSVIEDDRGAFSFEFGESQTSSSSTGSVDAGIPIYLSAIMEWTIQYCFPMISISIRTDIAWYRLGMPAKLYKPWYKPVVKIARLVMGVINMLKCQSRVSRLSLSDVVRKISEFKKDHPSHISSNIAVVEQYVLVHGQIILQQFSEYPDKLIQRCAFVTRLSEKMHERKHTMLKKRKHVPVKEEGKQIPNLGIEPMSSKTKVMRATMTRLINRIWGEYYTNYLPKDTQELQDSKLRENKELEEEEEENDEEEDMGEENISIGEKKLLKLPSSMKICKSKASDKEIKWEGKSIGNTISGESLYRSAMVQGDLVTVGGSVMVETYESEEVAAIFLVEYMFEKLNGQKVVHGRLMQRGSMTLLGNAANVREVFLTNYCMEFELGDVKETVVVDIRLISWGHEHRNKQSNANVLDREKEKERKKKGLAMELYCKCLYEPESGSFLTLPYGKLGLGTGYCCSCRKRETQGDYFGVNSSMTSFIFKNIEYHVGDYLYVRPQCFDEVKEEYETSIGGRSMGLKAYVVCHLMEIEAVKEPKDPFPGSTKVKVRRFYRPEDVSAAKAYCSDIREVYYSEDIFSVLVEMIEGKCEVRKRKDVPNLEFPIIDHIFFCEYSYDAVKGSIKQLPFNMGLISHTGEAVDSDLSNKKGKNECKEGQDQVERWKGMPREDRLATFDIFAGCGGLSEGFQQSGVSFTKWAIEYEQTAGKAFCNNHPEALLFTDNCNVILRAVMEKFGDADDCVSTPEASELARALDKEKVNNLPMPGQVDFINGGPPCQGFSKLNRFSQGTWSKIQCEMISAYLSFADYLRPRFFLLENVRNFISFNKGQMFRLTIASLLEMGYQVRFGSLEAGAYGVPQSRKRAFIWAASPAEALPEWPEPMHVFPGPALKITLPGGMQYAAVKSTARGAPFRSITVRDAIGDLPRVHNGASKLTIDYQTDPVSWFQKQIRGSMMFLNDHISKEMNELNLIRCKHVPKCPDANWRNLPDEKVKLSNGQMVSLIPCFLPNTAERCKPRNQWKGVFGRLEWEGIFPTSITDPQPMGKVGKCLHPEQDRIITVRECARSQGFPDSYRFVGNIQNKHSQIGNAVPPPLAYVLGRKLKEAVDARRSST